MNLQSYPCHIPGSACWHAVSCPIACKLITWPDTANKRPPSGLIPRSWTCREAVHQAIPTICHSLWLTCGMCRPHARTCRMVPTPMVSARRGTCRSPKKSAAASRRVTLSSHTSRVRLSLLDLHGSTACRSDWRPHTLHRHLDWGLRWHSSMPACCDWCAWGTESPSGCGALRPPPMVFVGRVFRGWV